MPRPSFRLIAFAIFCFFLAAVAWYGARWADRLPSQIAALGEATLEKKALELRNRFFALANFQPRLRVREKIIAEKTASISEIAVLEKVIEVEREFVHTWAGSTKTLRLRGKYRIKVGFNLLDRIEILVTRSHSRITLPPATILSIEQQELQVEALENGLWNPISADDLQSSIAAMQEQAAQSQRRELISQAEKTFAERLRRLAEPPVEILPVAPGKIPL